ncbi:MAG: hypothetical protein KY445_12225 [Armatimonadetes bacterium]|nr:hypothetical protein [Armatimonadota bacterium]
MRLEIDFPESVARDVMQKAREKGMEPEHWVLHYVMRKIFEDEHCRRSAGFDQLAYEILTKRAPLMEALARSEREDAAMAPEELAAKYPNRH